MPDDTRSYLDWNASAPLRPEARQALLEAVERFGNPSSPHAEGRAARDLLESSREGVAAFLGCTPAEVVFTSGGTEANNLALASLAAGAGQREFCAARIEHPSVLRPLEALEAQGWQGRWLAVGPEGQVDPAGAAAAAGFGVLQGANHETGAVQPLEAFAEACAGAGTPWHCDAVQLWGRRRVALGELGCATASLSGHKIGAPKGVGALYVRRGTPVAPLLRGGPQERERRAGTENLPGIAALAAACEAAAEDLEADARWMAGLRDRIVAGARQTHPHTWLNGPEDPDEALPNTANLSFPGIPSETLVMALDLEGVAVSAGSACTSGAMQASAVLQAMGLPSWRAESAVRVSVGPTTRPEDVDRFLAALERVVRRVRG